MTAVNLQQAEAEGNDETTSEGHDQASASIMDDQDLHEQPGKPQ